ncbi:MAG: pyrroloquinoline quinone-dependent dehydrogenase [Pseudohongiella sp.]|nr:pyrroloquinoline quinone-dependent dehydrogenase [Pseudohongiella sp.]
MRAGVWVLMLMAGSAIAAEWNQYGGEGGQQYTSLDQIRADNLQHLTPAWTYRSGDLNEGFTYKAHSFQANPVFWEDKLFISTSANTAIAVDAATGEQLWAFDPELPREIAYSESASRGVSLWHGASSVCPDRVLLGTLTGMVYALNAETGQLCSDFGDQKGWVDLGATAGASGDWLGDYSVTSPPVVVGDQLIVGSAIGDNQAVESPLGIVRALDVRTGSTNWIWDPIPRAANDPMRSEWAGNSADITGAANVWAPMSVDEELGLVYVSTSSPSPDFYGGERLGDNRYANSLVALDVKTGTVAWHFQLIHHDVWDYDIPAQPTLTDIRRGDVSIPAVIIVTKTAMLYAFDRRTGMPLFDVEERPVPVSDVPGEELSRTQPFSSIPPLASHAALTEDDAFGVAFFDKRECRNILREFRSEGIFTPPSLRGTVQSPGYAGGANWGGVAVDPVRQIAITNVNQIPGLVKLIPRDELDDLRASGELEGWQISRQTGTPYVMARRIFLSSLGMPCTTPPWGKLVAVDLLGGEILWDIPLGTIADLAPAFVPNFKWGVPNIGGAMVTASGLVVIGAATEHLLRIFDIHSGEELWSHRLPTSANATPMSYAVDGVQYIAIAVGGHEGLGTQAGDYLMAFKIGVGEIKK